MTRTLSDAERVHPTAVIDAEAVLAPDVRVGPFAIIEGPVEIGPGCEIEGHACLIGPLVLGRDNLVGHGALLGKAPSPRGDGGRLEVGDQNVFREYVVVQRGSVPDRATRVGHQNYVMIGAHVGPDVVIHNGCTLVNGAMIEAGAELHSGCVLSAHSAVGPRVRIGRLAMIGGLGTTSRDIPPFVLQQGVDSVSGLNAVGLRRAGLSAQAIRALRFAYRVLYKEGRARADALERIEQECGDVPEVAEFLAFIRASELGINPARSVEKTAIAS